MSATIDVTEKQLRARRDHLIAATKMPEKDLWKRAEDYTLTSEQRLLVEEILSIDFLLGDDTHRHSC